MTNAWSFLYDTMLENKNDEIVILGGANVNEAKPADYEDFWGSSMQAYGSWSSSYSPDTISFSSDGISDVIGGQNIISFDLPKPFNSSTSNNRRKYDEDEIIKELQEYIGRTYQQHYSAGSDNIQTLDLIEACGDGEAFCRSNILKYASRYDKKGTARRDIMKILHYAVLLMHFNDKNAQRETYPQ